jgi:hypothetical protein
LFFLRWPVRHIDNFKTIGFLIQIDKKSPKEGENPGFRTKIRAFLNQPPNVPVRKPAGFRTGTFGLPIGNPDIAEREPGVFVTKSYEFPSAND